MRARELALHKRGVGPIAGVDEAGRGPLMGPVVAAAVVIPLHVHIEGIADSKALTHQRREELFELIKNHPDVHHAVSIVDHHTIDRYARGAARAVCVRCMQCMQCMWCMWCVRWWCVRCVRCAQSSPAPAVLAASILLTCCLHLHLCCFFLIIVSSILLHTLLMNA